MLQRLLTGFLEQEGVEQAVMFDDRGRLMASVGQQGQLPALEHAYRPHLSGPECLCRT